VSRAKEVSFMLRCFALFAVAGVLVVAGACTADLADLDPCHDLAQAYCTRLSSCGAAGIEQSQCATDLETLCRNVNESSAQGGSHDCAQALASGCDPILPDQCSNLEAAIGCNACPSTAATTEARAACCDISLFSVVCAGCP
jgi:hypothetical protein